MKRLIACMGRVCQEANHSATFIVRAVLMIPSTVASYMGSLLTSWSLARELIPYGLHSSAIKAGLGRLCGNLHQSANTWSQILGGLEKLYQDNPSQCSRLEKVLTKIYSELVENYFLTGFVDDAALIMIRANRIIGLDSLPKTCSFDVRTAHVVKTGIAASKLLEKGGFEAVQISSGKIDDVSDGSKQNVKVDLVNHSRMNPLEQALLHTEQSTNCKVIPLQPRRRGLNS